MKLNRNITVNPICSSVLKAGETAITMSDNAVMKLSDNTLAVLTGDLTGRILNAHRTVIPINLELTEITDGQ